jgi:hypothetical protein
MTEFKAGDRVRVTDIYPRGEENPEEKNRSMRGLLGTVVSDNSSLGFVPVLLDEDSTKPKSWGYFFTEELELVVDENEYAS